MLTGSLGVGGHQDLSLESFCNFLSSAEGKVGGEAVYEGVKGQVWTLLYELQALVGLRPLGKRATLPSQSKHQRAKTEDNQ